MALIPDNEKHAKQIKAGTTGRNRGHSFEGWVTNQINSLHDYSIVESDGSRKNHIVTGHPAIELLKYIIKTKAYKNIVSIKAWWVGALATGGVGDVLYDENGNEVRKCKSDIVIQITHASGVSVEGVSVKTCSKSSPTNAQLFFTTAEAFCKLLSDNGLKVDREAVVAMKMFCGDLGVRPKDSGNMNERKSDPDRWYWEELPEGGREKLEVLLTNYQDQITQLLLQKAYKLDPYPPQFVMHQTKKFEEIENCEVAFFEMSELLHLSRKYSGFKTVPYRINKGRFKGDRNEHLAPRFGIVQFQRGGQKQHPTQLQFNLQAGYFYKILNS
jgi:hypothetical protein